MVKDFVELLDDDETDEGEKGQVGTSSTKRRTIQENLTADVKDYLHFLIFNRLDYKLTWILYYILTCIIFGAIISGMDNIPYIDGLFMAASAMTGSGLSTVGMYQLSTGSFCIMAILMMIGCAPFMVMMLIAFRRNGFAKVTAKVSELRRKKLIPAEKRLNDEEKAIIEDCFLMDEALGVLGYVTLCYYIGMLVTGILILHSALHLRPTQPELLTRNFSNLDSATFLAISAFANTGLTLTSDNLMGLSDNPCAYILLTFLILAGNTALPIFLRVWISFILYVETHVLARWYDHYVPIPANNNLRNRNLSHHSEDEESAHDDGPVNNTTPFNDINNNGPVVQESSRAHYRRILQFILDNPRRLTSVLYSHLQTKVLAGMVSLLICIQYCFFLGSTMNRASALAKHDRFTLAGIGYFQTLSTRSAGFAMMDLRELNQGLVFIYAVMMYMSAFPFVAAFEKASKTTDQANINANTNTNSYHSNNNNNGLVVSTASSGTSDMVAVAAGAGLSQRRKSTLQTLSAKSIYSDNSNTTVNSSATVTNPLHSLDHDLETMDDKDIKVSHINKKFISQFLARHSFFLILSVLICAYSEDEMLTDPHIDINLWYIVFEIISSYGNVGLSLGVPGQVYSLSGAMTVTGKFIMVCVMWLGKHRGLSSAKEEVVDFACERYLRACRVDSVVVRAQDNDKSDDNNHNNHVDGDKNVDNGLQEKYNPLLTASASVSGVV